MTASNGATPASPFDPTGTYQCGATGSSNWVGFKAIPGVSPQVDRLPLEGIVGWDATVNGNLAQLLNEPTLMGAYEGAAITVVAKGVRYPVGAPYLFGNGPDSGTVATEGQFPLSTRLLTNGVASAANKVIHGDECKDFPSNFLCAPSAIDGLSLTDSSQGGGGIFSHAWGHNLQIANNRIFSNIGTLSGGINIGQGESPDALLASNSGDPLAPTGGFDQQPWTCLPGSINNDGSDNANPENLANNTQMPYCYNRYVNVHHNAVTTNTSIGDELFSGTPAGAGGVSFCTGADYYKFNYNWVCGNMSTGDGGGFSHVGFIYDSDIEKARNRDRGDVTDPKVEERLGAISDKTMVGAPRPISMMRLKRVPATCDATTLHRSRCQIRTSTRRPSLIPRASRSSDRVRSHPGVRP
jgi:hypothetical protein